MSERLDSNPDAGAVNSGVQQEGDPHDGLPTIQREEFTWARDEFQKWLRRWGWTSVVPFVLGAGALALGFPLVGAVALGGLAYDILGVCVLALPLLDLTEIGWAGTYGGFRRERRSALLDRKKALLGLALVVLGFLLQIAAVVGVASMSAPSR